MDKNLMRDLLLSSAAYSLSSILGPLLFFGIPGYFLDKYFGTKPAILLASIFLAFIVTNILLYKKVKKINLMIATQSPNRDELKESEHEQEEVENKLSPETKLD
jgi:F0F1-type ATP synthase assembly protein I